MRCAKRIVIKMSNKQKKINRSFQKRFQIINKPPGEVWRGR